MCLWIPADSHIIIKTILTITNNIIFFIKKEMQNTKAIKDFWQGVEELNRRNEINKKKVSVISAFLHKRKKQ